MHDDGPVTKEGILSLFNLEDKALDSVSCANEDGMMRVNVQLARKNEPCPSCGSFNSRVKDYHVRRLTHSALSDRKCVLFYNARRYLCKDCGRSFMEHNPFCFGGMTISALTVKNVLEDLKKPTETFSSVAERYHISPASAAYIFDQHVMIPRHALPEIICIDEVFAFHSEYSRFVCLMLDFETGKPVDALNSRRLDVLESYFLSIPLEERDKVKGVCSDMYEAYRTVTQKYFRFAKHYVDHFHLVQELSRQVDHVRIRVMKGCEKNSDEYYILKHFNWILYKPSDEKAKDGKPLFDPGRERRYNNHYKAYLNFYELREKLLSTSPDLLEAWKLKEDVYDFYQTCTPENGIAEIDGLIARFANSNIAEMAHFGKTMKKWKTSIVNSLAIYGYAYKVEKGTGQVAARQLRITNSIIEGRNKIAKELKNNANGYRCWERFRNRLMYVLDKDATFSLSPIQRNGAKGGAE